MRVCYLSEQSVLTLAVQLEEAGFTKEEVQNIPKEDFLLIPREEWDIPGFTYYDMLAQLEERFLQKGSYDALVADTFHSIAQLDDQNDDAEVLRVAKLTTSLSVRYGLGGVLNRHDRKSGGALGVSGRNSIAPTGAVDNVLHLLQIPGRATNFRKLELGGRTLGFPEPLVISREIDGRYVVWEGDTPAVNEVNEQRAEEARKIQTLITEWLREDQSLTTNQLRDMLQENKIERSIRSIEPYVAAARKTLKNGGV